MEVTRVMFDSQCDLAALVYEHDQDPDQILRAFAADLNSGGYRALGLIQFGRRCLDAGLCATMVHTGERLRLFHDLGTGSTACRLDVDQLLDAGERIARAIDQGADVLIINRFGKQESAGKGLCYLIERALGADIPVVIAVSGRYFPDWIKFADGMSVRLPCDRRALDAWWRDVSTRYPRPVAHAHQTICEICK